LPGGRPGFAGALPAVWKVPLRHPRFTGRDGMLTELRRRLHASEGTLVVQALYGLGGVGKTQLAIEYAHRFAADYDLVWWIDRATGTHPRATGRPRRPAGPAGRTDDHRHRRPAAGRAARPDPLAARPGQRGAATGRRGLPTCPAGPGTC
jgi:hypothetical protein